MALVKCPECGKEVSEHADACPQCGFPIRSIKSSNTIKIKLPTNPFDGPFSVKVSYKSGEELGKYNCGAMLNLEATQRVDLVLKIYLHSWDISVYPGKKYALSWASGWMKPKLICNEVDLFDSD